MRGNAFTCQVKDFAIFIQLASSCTSSCFDANCGGAFDRTRLEEDGQRNGDVFQFLNGTDPALQIPLRMTYTTRPSQDLSAQ
uniref:Secreted protein n=1 Tax=Heterorhabditis bacteriophora TaxID=37862 RepID=A0A1I7WRD0_HETBA